MSSEHITNSRNTCQVNLISNGHEIQSNNLFFIHTQMPILHNKIITVIIN